MSGSSTRSFQYFFVFCCPFSEIETLDFNTSSIFASDSLSLELFVSGDSLPETWESDEASKGNMGSKLIRPANCSSSVLLSYLMEFEVVPSLINFSKFLGIMSEKICESE